MNNKLINGRYRNAKVDFIYLDLQIKQKVE